MKTTIAVGVFALVAFAGVRPCEASGFLIYDLSADAMGRASAVAAGTRGADAVWFNPAALSYTKGLNVSAGAVFITTRSRFTAADTGDETSSHRGSFVLPAVFGSYALDNGIGLGLGVYSAFGIGLRWPDDWAGNQNSIEANLHAVNINPTLSLRLHPQVSIGVGFDAVLGAVEFRNALPELIGGQVRLGGDAQGYGFNAGLLYRPLPDEVQLALTYRSRVKLDFDGRADFDPARPEFARSLLDQAGTASITLPDMLTFGVMARPLPELALSFDANVVFWGSYDEVAIDFDTAPDRSLRPDGHTSVTLRGGVDVEPRRGFHARGGLIYDRSAIPASGISPTVPDSNRIDVTAGLGYEHGHFGGDLGYMIVCFLPADARGNSESPAGTYHTLAHLVALTLTTHWP